MILKLTIEYDGTNYSGWQLQAQHDSIQGRIEAALEKIFATSVRVHGAGRTDAGVHARGQVASIKLPREFDPASLLRALNATLPDDIVVLDVAEAADNFDPRRHAKSRVYEYRVLNRRLRSAFDYRYSWLVREPLDLSAMNDGARVFLGEHDFAAFQTLGSDVKTTIRDVLVNEWNRDGEFLIYRVEATAFLRHMVRTMVAAMIDAGKGKLSAAQIATILRVCDRQNAPAPAPPGGLYLVEVRY